MPSRLKSLLGLLAIFLLGMIAGGLVTAKIVQMKIRHIVESGPDALSETLTAGLSRRLSLDQAQRQALADITTRARAQLKDIRREVQPRTDAILQSSAAELRTHLRPEQQQNLDTLLTRTRPAWLLPDPVPAAP